MTAEVGPGSSDRAIYEERVNAVIDHIDANLDRNLGLDELAEVARFSRFHFHRLFTAMVGETVHRFTARLRVERAARLLMQHPAKSITDVSVQCGYATPSAFARSFKTAHGMTPSDWRSGLHRSTDPGDTRLVGRSLRGSEVDIEPIYSGRSRRWALVAPGLAPATVSVERRPAIEAAYVRHIGPFQGQADLFAALFGRLGGWAASQSPPIAVGETFAIYHDDPNLTDDDRLRVSVAMPLAAGAKITGGVGRTTVPSGRYAIGRFELGDAEYGTAWAALLSGWLPASGYEPSDQQVFFERFPTTGPTGSTEPAADGRRVVEICIPVRLLRR